MFFWGNDDIYSNFYYYPFKHQGIDFKWSEQAIMYRKANLFGANNIADRILKAQTPKQCKDLGRSNEIPFDEKVWIANREIIYGDVLFDKFSNTILKSKILATGNKILVEASPFDKIWGIGIAKTINVQKILKSGKG
ncbi:NADAR family protein [Gottfriedia sp. NPDC057991]|uniref:NADAR family protein n=1 Tax=Gottfriedia sp. NPDC057991 TaxID=3346298 RepID=UPI0036D873DD